MTGWLGEEKQDTSRGQARLGQAEEAGEMEYIYRPVLATNKKAICDPDSKTHIDTALKSNILVFQYTKGAYNKDKVRRFAKTCSDRTRANVFKLKDLDWT